MITNTDLDQLIERAKPELRKALESALSGAAVHTFNIADGTNSQTGVKSNFVCFIAHEYTAMVLEAVAQGLAASSQKAMADMMAARKEQPRIIKPS
jgi:hypothetical protein